MVSSVWIFVLSAKPLTGQGETAYIAKMLKNTPDAYGLASKLFHWAMALLILPMLAIGLYMTSLPMEAPGKFALYGLHKSIGVMVLAIVVARFCWRQYSKPPIANPAHPQWERGFASFVHYALYAAAFLMPLSGWAMSSAGGHPVAFFGLPLPALVEKNELLGNFFKTAHGVLGWSLIVLISLHVLGALKHYVLDRDKTLQRIFFGRDKP